MNVDVKTASDLAFRPEQFFLGKTAGGGLVRDPFGKVVRRYAVTTRGTRDDAYGAIQVDHTFVFDNGEIDVMTWLISEAGEGRYAVAAPQAGSGIVAQIVDGDFAFAINRRFKSRFGPLKARFFIRLTLVEPETALGNTRVHVLGAPFSVMTAVHRRSGA